MWAARSVITGTLLGTALGLAQTVQISNGTIQGGKCAYTNSDYFFSIPYAQPPTGDLRLAPPQPHLNPFNGILNATAAAPSCMQYNSLFGESGVQSEDCLYLNVWAPSSATPESKLPVKVWIYGGSNEAGGIADSTYDGCYATTDSIVVSVNYRVGPLGYLALSNLGLTGNYGIMDQLLGLRWVQENIEAFGGDASKVLLFGQSAGAIDTYSIATLAEAPKLISAAVMESGGGRDAPAQERIQTLHQLFLDALNCTTADISCVRAASTDAIAAANHAMPAEPAPGASTPFNHGGGRTWGPVVDGAVIPVTPNVTGLQVPSILGFTSAEGTLFILGKYGVSTFTGLNQSIYDEFLAYNFGPLASVVNAAFSVDKFGGSYYMAMSFILGEVAYKCPGHRGLRRAQAAGVPVWSYEFAHEPSCAWYSKIPASILSFIGAAHTSEIPFVFNTTDNMPLPGGNCTFTVAEKAIAEFMSKTWTNMAAAGHPAEAGIWPQWTPASSAGVNIADAVVVGTVDYTTCAFWDSIYEQSLDAAQCSQCL